MLRKEELAPKKKKKNSDSSPVTHDGSTRNQTEGATANDVFVRSLSSCGVNSASVVLGIVLLST